MMCTHMCLSAVIRDSLCCVQLKWELGSPLFGLLLRRYAPHDIYEVCIMPHVSCHHRPCSLTSPVTINAVYLSRPDLRVHIL